MDKNLLERLKKSQGKFSESFPDKVMTQIQDLGRNSRIIPLHKYMGIAAAACLVAMILTSYLTYGQLDTDSLLGLGDIDVTDSINPFFEEDLNTIGE